MALSGMKILLAEDNPTNQMVAVQMLESLGANVELAVDGAEALEVLEQRTFDVALIDIEMPRISGIDLIRKLRSDGGPLSEMPLIALTAYVMREHRAAIEEAGADGIIAKPILSIEQFGDDILGYLRQRNADWAPAGASEQTAAVPTVIDGFDVEAFERLCSAFQGDALRELTGKICLDIGGTRDRIAQALTTDDMAEIKAGSHILISVAGLIGATKLQKLAQRLNSAGETADVAVIARDGPALIEEADKVVAYVRGANEE